MRKTSKTTEYVGLCLVFLLMLLVSCYASEKPSGTGQIATLPKFQLLPGDKNEVADVTNLINDVLTIKLSPEVANEVGVIFHFAVVDSGHVILVDEISGKINRVNKEGQIVWQIEARGDDFRYHNGIEEFTYDKYHRQLIVYDETQVFKYDLDGKPLVVEPSAGFDFHQMIYASSNDVIHSIQGFQNIGLAESPKQLVWIENNNLKKLFVEGLPRTASSSLIGGYPEFNLLNDYLHYHATFRDTFYRIDLPDVYPAFTFSFDVPVTTDDVMEMDKVRRKIKYVYQERIPKVYSLAADADKVVLSYQKGAIVFFAFFNRQKEKWLINNHILRFEQLSFEAPLLYQDGYFLRMIPQYQTDHYAQLPEQTTDIPQDWKKELEELDDEYDELGSKTLYLIKV
ncbi:MAG: 6-bladed beta-propeller [Lewinella sp.]